MVYNLIRTKRRTLALYIRPGGKLEVRAPLHMSEREIARAVESKADWIEKHIAASIAASEEVGEYHVAYGGQVIFRGVLYPVVAGGGGFDGEVFHVPDGLDENGLRAEIYAEYRRLALPLFTGIIGRYATDMDVSPSSLGVTSAKTRFGSCSGRNAINFSWRLALYPDSVIDYVVVHELAHITEHNHSAAFWKIVGGILPDWKERRKKLREFSRRPETAYWNTI